MSKPELAPLSGAANAEDLRIYFEFLAGRMQTYEARHHQAFLLFATGLAAIAALRSYEGAIQLDSLQKLSIIVLGLACWFVMWRSHGLERHYRTLLRIVMQHWKIDDAINPYRTFPVHRMDRRGFLVTHDFMNFVVVLVLLGFVVDLAWPELWPHLWSYLWPYIAPFAGGHE